ncbi:UNVERIFIED_CONTAM: hypothetical protein GTU68_034434, partial [Idotea baltica]|nr:hypothetical protein [Idotea baltica]
HPGDEAARVPSERALLVLLQARPHASLLAQAEAGSDLAPGRCAVRGGERGQPGRGGEAAALHSLALPEPPLSHLLHSLLALRSREVSFYRLHRNTWCRG